MWVFLQTVLAQPRIGTEAVPPAVQHGWEKVRYDPSETWAAEGGQWIVRENDEGYGGNRDINLKFKKFVTCLVNLLVVLDFSIYKQTPLKDGFFAYRHVRELQKSGWGSILRKWRELRLCPWLSCWAGHMPKRHPSNILSRRLVDLPKLQLSHVKRLAGGVKRMKEGSRMLLAWVVLASCQQASLVWFIARDLQCCTWTCLILYFSSCLCSCSSFCSSIYYRCIFCCSLLFNKPKRWIWLQWFGSNIQISATFQHAPTKTCFANSKEPSRYRMNKASEVHWLKFD